MLGGGLFFLSFCLSFLADANLLTGFAFQYIDKSFLSLKLQKKKHL